MNTSHTVEELQRQISQGESLELGWGLSSTNGCEDRLQWVKGRGNCNENKSSLFRMPNPNDKPGSRLPFPLAQSSACAMMEPGKTERPVCIIF